jgi:hypothetical protein
VKDHEGATVGAGTKAEAYVPEPCMRSIMGRWREAGAAFRLLAPMST